MNAYKVIPISTSIAQHMRVHMLDDYGNELSIRTAAYPNAYPCRHCLGYAKQHSGIVLFAYTPFKTPGPYSEVGPVFVCSDECQSYADINHLPPVVTHNHVGLRTYNQHHELLYLHSGLVQGKDAQNALEKVFREPEVAYAHFRTAQYGCFLCAVERL